MSTNPIQSHPKKLLPIPILTLLPLHIQIIHKPPTLLRRRQHAIQIRRKRRERNFRIHIQHCLAAARGPNCNRRAVLLVVFTVVGACEG